MSAPFRVVVAPDKFKGSLRAEEVAATVTAVLEQAGVEVVQHPVADGGEGTVDLALAAGFAPVTVDVTGPLGEPVRATFALRDGVAVLEMAAAAGLGLLPGDPDPETAWAATTYGVGELVRSALDHGATRVVLGVGGSATTDGGAGAVESFGGDPRLADADLVIACDVDNPLLGPDGAAAVYGPQKGADAAVLARLEERLTAWADDVARRTGEDHRDDPGAGAAGGLAFGLVALAGGRLTSGVELLLDLTGFAEVAATADLVVVGEGSLDEQSLRGKGPVGIARALADGGVPVVAIAGRTSLSPEQARATGLAAVYALSDVEPDAAVSMRDAERLLTDVAQRLAADWLPGG